MKLKDFIKEEVKIIKTNSNKKAKIYLNPTKEEIKQLFQNAPPKDKRDEGTFRCIIYMPSPEKKYLYIWSARDGSHDETDILYPFPNNAPKEDVQIGWAEIDKNYNIKFSNKIKINGKWNWLKNYGMKLRK
jgi:hypothetical protein